MKWIEIEKAKSLAFNEEVLIQDKSGITIGKLVEKKHTADGIKNTFLVHVPSDAVPANDDPVYSTTVTHVAYLTVAVSDNG